MRSNLVAVSLFCVGLISVCSASPAKADENVSESLSAVMVRTAHVSQSQADEQVEKVFTAIRTALKSGKAVEIKNFGRFYVSERKPTVRKDAVNVPDKMPQAGKKFAHFTSSDSLKLDLNSQKS